MSTPQQRKRAREDRDYLAKRRAYLEAHPFCEVASPVCTGESTEISHIAGNGRTGGAGRLDEENWDAACHSCGQYVESHMAWALETGHHMHAWDYARLVAERAA